MYNSVEFDIKFYEPSVGFSIGKSEGQYTPVLQVVLKEISNIGQRSGKYLSGNVSLLLADICKSE